ncbi:phosphoribosyltransferase family protein [Streptomyces sp. NPDC004726]
MPAGHHSSEFWDKSAVLQRPPAADRLFAALAERIGGLGAEVIAGPAKGGMVVAWGVARHLGVDALFLERPLAEGPFTLSRGHRVAPAARVVVVDDILSSGRTLGAAIDALEPFTVAGIGVLVDRSGGLPEPEVPRFPLPVVSLTAVDAPAVWAPEECPLCAAGIPLADGRSPVPPAAG